VFYENPALAIDFLCQAFGFSVQIRVDGEDGKIVHSEFTVPGGLVMVGGAGPARVRPEATHCSSLRALNGANTQSIMMYVDTHCATAREAGARIVSEPKATDYGTDYWSDRGYEAEDLEGHRWWFVQRLRNPLSSTTDTDSGTGLDAGTRDTALPIRGRARRAFRSASGTPLARA
jgi:uncharacterized glyoxalase superfamily protein PhnB